MRPDELIRIFINRKKYELDAAEQTGRSLKELAGIPLGDPLFLDNGNDDELIANDATVVLKNGRHLYSQAAADYGFDEGILAEAGISTEQVSVHPQPGGWNFLVIEDFEIPKGYNARTVTLLIKLPPLFPDAQPDMFWVQPALLTERGSQPRATSSEVLLGQRWQRFSWHLKGGAWVAGQSTLRDYLRCVRGRLLRQD